MLYNNFIDTIQLYLSIDKIHSNNNNNNNNSLLFTNNSFDLLLCWGAANKTNEPHLGNIIKGNNVVN